MGTIRIEYVPIKKYNLGLLGLDHLQIVFEDETSFVNKQDNWYVLEGTHDGGLLDGSLGVLGEEIETPLSAANGVNGAQLLDLIGTPESRGSRVVYQFADASTFWTQMMTYGQEIQAQEFPYEGFSWPFSPGAIINSSSVVASLLNSIGVNVNFNMPFGLRLSPGTSTILGTTHDDDITIGGSFTQVAGGFGEDILRGSDNLVWPEKFYGGDDNDTIVWSKGEDIIHGGQPRLPYALDGTDTIDYSGVGSVNIIATQHAVEHKVPDLLAAFDGGGDQLFSIEAINWYRETDIISLGQGVDLLETPIRLNLDQSEGGRGDELGFQNTSAPLVVNVVDNDLISVQTQENAGLDAGYWAQSVEWVTGSAGNDRIYAGGGLRGADGGDGGDVVDGRLAHPFSLGSPNGFDIELSGGNGSDTLISGTGYSLASGGADDDRFVLSAMTSGQSAHTEFVIADAGPEDTLYVPYNFFAEVRGDFDGSQLMQLTGAPFKIDENITQSFFEWGPPRNDLDHGFIDFVGDIFFYMDGTDLVIDLKQGTVEVIHGTDGHGHPTPPVRAIINDDTTETLIRVVDWQEGDLGLHFPISYDPNAVSPPDDFYPGYTAAVNSLVNPGIFSDPLALRPEAYLPQDLQTAAPVTIARFATLAAAVASPDGTDGDDVINMPDGGPYKMHGLGGNDDMNGSSGGDVIDGGTGDDTMSGGRGNDVYFVDTAGDQVIEDSRGGFDRVYAGIDYTLPGEVEHLTLTGTAIAGHGNDLRNTIVGNDQNNVLEAGNGNDTLSGNRGDDTLAGGTGADGYVYELGDGNDVILETPDVNGADVLVFAGQMTADDFTFTRNPFALDDLVIRFIDGGSITVAGFYAPGGGTIDGVEFVNGETWTSEVLQAHAATAAVTANRAPVAADDTYVYAGENSFRLPVAALLDNDHDPDGDALTIASIKSQSEGSAVLDGNEIVVTAGAGAKPAAVFTYVVSDASGATATATAEITFWPNQAPIISSMQLDPVQHNAPASGHITASDPNQDTVLYSIKDGAGPSLGAVAFQTDGHFTYTPYAGAVGSDSFTILVGDAFGASAEAAFNVAIGNNAPVITAAELPPVHHDTPASGLIAASDADQDALVYDVKNGAGPSLGSITFQAGGNFTYTPTPGALGNDSFTLLVSDAYGGSADASFQVTITNQAPVITNSTLGPVVEDTIATGLIEANDPEGDGIAFAIKAGAGPAKGSVALSQTGDFTYTPDLNANGHDSFTISATDALGAVTDQVFSFDIAAVNDAPHATDDSGFTLNAGTTLAIASTALLANDSDPDNDALSVTSVLDASGGTVTLDGSGNVLFTANPAFQGAAQFSYTISDGNAGQDTATVALTVAPGGYPADHLFTGTNARDVLTGTPYDDVFNGKKGNDILNGAAGNDIFLVSGDDGLDRVNGGSGYDVVRGSAHDDIIRVTSRFANLTNVEEIDGGGGFDRIVASEDDDRLDLSSLKITSIEAVSLGEGDDWVNGTSANETFYGGEGRDTFHFANRNGHDVVADFSSRSASSRHGGCDHEGSDILDLRDWHLGGPAALSRISHQQGCDLVIELDAQTSITVRDATLSAIARDVLL